MKDNYVSMRSGISKAKNLGSSKHGVSHWIAQRISAITLVPIVIWLVFNIFSYKFSPDEGMPGDFTMILSAVTFLVISLYHGYIGMVVVIEDYIKSLKFRYFLIISLKIITYFTIFIAIMVTTQH